MKRFLFCAGILALAASCTQDDFESTSMQQSQLKGISFETAVAKTTNDPTTKGEYEVTTGEDGKKEFAFRWYGEQDRISIWSTNTKPYTDAGTATANPDWDLAQTASTYKATQSDKITGKFTGIDDKNILNFFYTPDKYEAEKDAKKRAAMQAKFFAVYPTTVKVAAVPTTNANYFLLNTLPDLTNQSQTNLVGSDFVEKMMMWSLTEGVEPSKDYTAVGEAIDLSFTRPYTAVVFSTKGVDDYQNDFGGLSSITMTMKGYDANGDGDYTDNGDINPSVLYYGGAQYKVNLDDLSKSTIVGNDGKEEIVVTSGNGKTANVTSANTELKLNVNNQKWSDENNAFMAIYNVNRDVYKGDAKESVDITYDFKNITLVQPLSTTANWPPKVNDFVGAPALDISSYPYLVTKAGTNAYGGRTLIVNKNNFSDIYDKEDDEVIVWNDEKVALSEITKIVSKVALSPAEMERLKEYTALVDIELAENTEIPEGTFTDENATLTTIKFKKVTTIESGAFDDEIKLTHVELPAYEFAAANANTIKEFLKPTHLEYLDMSAAKELSVGFPSTGFSLNGYDKLKTVIVNKDGLLVGSHAFANCSTLTTVTGKVTIDRQTSTSAFENCDALVTINVTGTEFAAATFKGCDKLKNVRLNGKQVAPTYVSAEAFSGCVALTEMALDNATAVGQQAFYNCTSWYGSKNAEGKLIVKVGAEEIGSEAFAGCTALVHIEFLSATTFGRNCLDVDPTKSGKELLQVQFDKEVKWNDATYNTNDPFGNTDFTDVEIFVNPEQDMDTWTSNSLILGTSATKNIIKVESVQRASL